MIFTHTRLINKKQLPTEPGVYFIFAGGNLLYVGGTQNLKERFVDHKRFVDFREHGADGICYLPTRDWKRLERQYQVELTPPLNKELFLGESRFKSPKQGYLKVVGGFVVKVA
jgi:hypothetical protein